MKIEIRNRIKHRIRLDNEIEKLEKYIKENFNNPILNKLMIIIE